jgi:hypothetical protein
MFSLWITFNLLNQCLSDTNYFSATTAQNRVAAERLRYGWASACCPAHRTASTWIKNLGHFPSKGHLSE